MQASSGNLVECTSKKIKEPLKPLEFNKLHNLNQSNKILNEEKSKFLKTQATADSKQKSHMKKKSSNRISSDLKTQINNPSEKATENDYSFIEKYRFINNRVIQRESGSILKIKQSKNSKTKQPDTGINIKNEQCFGKNVKKIENFNRKEEDKNLNLENKNKGKTLPQKKIDSKSTFRGPQDIRNTKKRHKAIEREILKDPFLKVVVSGSISLEVTPDKRKRNHRKGPKKKIIDISFEEMESMPIRKKVKQEELQTNALNLSQKSDSCLSLSVKKPIFENPSSTQFSNDSSELVLRYKYYTGEGRANIIELHSYDVDKLASDCYLNDTLINFFLRFTVDQLVPPERRDKIYIFNTYFLPKLISSAKQKSELFEADFELTYNSVARVNVISWIDVNLFEKEFLVFPYHDEQQKHWALIIVCNPKYYLVKKEKNSHEKSPKSLAGKPFLIYFDSFAAMDKETSKLIAKYLQYELQHKKPELYEKLKNKFNTISESNMIQPIVPLQDNYCDCGIFLLQYAELFLCDPKKIIDNIKNDKNRLQWFPKSLIKAKREQLKKLVYSLRDDSVNAAIEYKAETQKIYDKCRDDENEYDKINEEEFKAFVKLYYDEQSGDLKRKVKEKARLVFYFLQNHEKVIRGSKILGVDDRKEQLKNLLSKYGVNDSDEAHPKKMT